MSIMWRALLLTVGVVSLSDAMAAPSRASAEGDKGIYAPLTIRLTYEDVQVDLRRAEETKLSAPLAAAKRFLAAARAANPDRLLNAFAAQDGSREAVRPQVRKRPDQYKRFGQAKKAIAESVTVWGSYALIDLDLRYANGRNFPITPIFYCDETCRLSTIERRNIDVVSAVYDLSAAHRAIRSRQGTGTSNGANDTSDDSERVRVAYEPPYGEAKPRVRATVAIDSVKERVSLEQFVKEERGDAGTRRAVEAVNVMLESASAKGDAQKGSQPGEGKYIYWYYGTGGEGGVRRYGTSRQIWKKQFGAPGEVRLLGWIAGDGYRQLVVQVNGAEKEVADLQFIGVNIEEKNTVVAQNAVPLVIENIARTMAFHEKVTEWAGIE